MFLSYKNSFGLLINEENVFIVRLGRANGKLVIAETVKVGIEPGIVRNGMIIDGEKFSASLKSILKERKIKEKNVCFVVPGNLVIGELITLDDKAMGYVDTIAAEEADKYMISDEKALFDYYQTDDRSIFLVIVKQDIIKGYITAIEKAGLNVFGAEFEPIASFKAVNTRQAGAEGKTPVIALVSAWKDRTGISIFKGGLLLYYRNIDEIETALVIKEIKLTFSYWETQHPDEKVDKTLLLSDSNKSKEIHLNLSDPAYNIEQGDPLGAGLEEDILSNSAGAGAAMKAGKRSLEKELVLLTKEKVRKIKYEKMFFGGLLYVSFILFVCFFGSLLFPRYQKIYELRHRPAYVMLKNQPRELREMEEIIKTRRDIFTQLSVLEQAYKTADIIPWTVVLKDISRVIPRKVWINSIKYGKEKIIYIEGSAVSQQEVYNYTRLLSVSEHFSDVTLRILENDPEKSAKEKVMIFNFQIACTLDSASFKGSEGADDNETQ